MKLGLLSLSILLVASLAACKKDYPSTTVGVNPDAPKPMDSTLKVKERKWNWGGNAPLSYKVGDNTYSSDASNTSFMSWQEPGGELKSQITATISASEGPIVFQMQIPGKFSEMLQDQEFAIPADINSFATITAQSGNPDIPLKYWKGTNDGGTMNVKITSKTSTDIEGKFYGVLKQYTKYPTTSGLGWIKVEEGYFKYKYN